LRYKKINVTDTWKNIDEETLQATINIKFDDFSNEEIISLATSAEQNAIVRVSYVTEYPDSEQSNGSKTSKTLNYLLATEGGNWRIIIVVGVDYNEL
jgi:hypothetical protein